jgi:hypothetical protein
MVGEEQPPNEDDDGGAAEPPSDLEHKRSSQPRGSHASAYERDADLKQRFGVEEKVVAEADALV